MSWEKCAWSIGMKIENHALVEIVKSQKREIKKPRNRRKRKIAKPQKQEIVKS